MTGVRGFTGSIALVALAGIGWLAGVAVRSRDRIRVVPAPMLAVTADEGAGMWLAPAHPGAETAVPVLRLFGDYQCPACQNLERLAGDSLRALALAGRIRFVYHHLPLRTHRLGRAAAATAYCALDSGVGWLVHSALYGTAAAWSRAAEPERSLIDAAVRAGADRVRLTACVTAGRATDRVRRDRELAEMLEVMAVPAVFLDGNRIEFVSTGALLRHVSTRTKGP